MVQRIQSGVEAMPLRAGMLRSNQRCFRVVILQRPWLTSRRYRAGMHALADLSCRVELKKAPYLAAAALSWILVLPGDTYAYSSAEMVAIDPGTSSVLLQRYKSLKGGSEAPSLRDKVLSKVQGEQSSGQSPTPPSLSQSLPATPSAGGGISPQVLASVGAVVAVGGLLAGGGRGKEGGRSGAGPVGTKKVPPSSGARKGTTATTNTKKVAPPAPLQPKVTITAGRQRSPLTTTKPGTQVARAIQGTQPIRGRSLPPAAGGKGASSGGRGTTINRVNEESATSVGLAVVVLLGVGLLGFMLSVTPKAGGPSRSPSSSDVDSLIDMNKAAVEYKGPLSTRSSPPPAYVPLPAKDSAQEAPSPEVPVQKGPGVQLIPEPPVDPLKAQLKAETTEPVQPTTQPSPQVPGTASPKSPPAEQGALQVPLSSTGGAKALSPSADGSSFLPLIGTGVVLLTGLGVLGALQNKEGETAAGAQGGSGTGEAAPVEVGATAPEPPAASPGVWTDDRQDQMRRKATDSTSAATQMPSGNPTGSTTQPPTA